MEINVIYILAPASAATGGPEALHQLANALNKNFNFKIKMVYLPKMYTTLCTTTIKITQSNTPILLMMMKKIF